MQKEKYEWIRSWCDDTERDDIPRLLLIGDSITEGYQSKVRDLLKDKYAVDYIATSYAIDCLFFNQLIEAFALDSVYDVIHFNHGLHGRHMMTEVYEEGMEILASKLNRMGKLIFATSTKTYHPGTADETEFHKLVLERNEAVKRIAARVSCPVDDLGAISEALPLSAYAGDGIHFSDEGYTVLAKAVADSILER